MINTQNENTAEFAREDALHQQSLAVATSDLGLAIRDFLEGQEFAIFEGDTDTGVRADVEFIDVSDPHNPIIHLANGQAFRVTIVSR